MNFDLLAPHFSWMERAFAGGLMHRCRTMFLDQARGRRRALLAGEGPGRFLAELLRSHPHIEVLCVEQSPAMIAEARERLEREGLLSSRVQFQQADILDWTAPEAKFDLIVTNFFLDCFQPGQLQHLVPMLAACATPDAIWLLADFRVPDRGWKRWRAALILSILYGFFQLSTRLSARWLTPPDALLATEGFVLAERRVVNFGFAHADYWHRQF